MGEKPREERTAGQVTDQAAVVYEEQLVPAIFGEWAPRIVDAAQVRPGDRVLDVACGTGVVTRELARLTGADRVTGIDVNPGMLAVARDQAPDLDYREGDAHDLPFEEGTFDAVICAWGIMFFQDRVQAIREMARVVRPGGHIVITTWDIFENQPPYIELAAVLREHLGADYANEVKGPFVLGDKKELLGLMEEGGLEDAHVRTVEGTIRAPSIRAFIEGEIEGWTLADKIDDEQLLHVVEAATPRIRSTVNERPDGVTVPFNGNIATGKRPDRVS